jgi:hypothetical protein
MMVVHKRNSRPTNPLVSVILLDWTCRESFHALDWLGKQDVPRDQYELLWVELYDRVVPAAMEKGDVLITCGQKGLYHKHVGYNVGLLQARGQVVTICDSDAVFPPQFVRSIMEQFNLGKPSDPTPKVLMHHEWRGRDLYPTELSDVSELSRFKWAKLAPNVGACMSVRRIDAIRFGGFDEHPSFRGYICGPYDLGWRLINAGIPEKWHDPSVALWHFAHPDPPASFDQRFSWKMYREATQPHFEFNAVTAVEAFSTGRLLPLRENVEIHKLRMSSRQIGSDIESRYAGLDVSYLLSRWGRFKLRLRLWFFPPPLERACFHYWRQLLKGFRAMVGDDRYARFKARWHSAPLAANPEAGKASHRPVGGGKSEVR